MSIAGAMVWVLLAAAKDPTPLDAGTWVRPSLTVLPVAAAPCEPASPRRMLEEWKAEHPTKGKRKPLPPSPERLRELSRARDHQCEEVRREVEEGGTAWTGLPKLHRFDSNPVGEDAARGVRDALVKGFGPFERALGDLAGPLQEWLSGTAIDRARHLESDFQKNSLVAEKAHEEDIVGSQVARVRDAAWILAERIEKLELRRTRSGWAVSGRRTLGLWRFDAAGSGRFRSRARWEEGFETEVVDPSRAAAAAFGAGSFDGRLLGLEDFRFTAQLDSSWGGWRPGSRLSSDTEEDLRIGRRFVYLEQVRRENGKVGREQVGYGFLERGSGDTWRLRHIGGRDPYDGLVAQEVPGDLWWTLGVERWAWEARPASSAGPGPALRVGGDPVGWGIRGGWRGHVPGDLPGQSLYLDLAASWASLNGRLDRTESGETVERTIDQAWVADLSAGWIARWNLRRIFLATGGGLGVRRLAVPLSGNGGVAGESAWAQADGLGAWQPHVDLLAGVQLSATASSGLGLQLRWEAWRGAPGWSATGGGGAAGPVAGTLQPGRLSLCLQWVGG